MREQELENKIKQLKQEFEQKKREAIIEYCNANNPYKVGDVFTDHIGSVIIEEIQYSERGMGRPSCVYWGWELKKDGTLKKGNPKRQAWQTNDVLRKTSSQTEPTI